MKKLFIITVLMALAMNGFAQILHYDFSAVCETGQTLYYLISSEEEHTVKITYPYSEANSFFQGNFYEGFPEPQGEIILPATVTYNDVDYAVTAIDNNAFFNCHLTGTLTISDGIVSIGSMGFIGCRFTSIIIPRSIGTIIPTAFAYCSNLETISVDDENPTFYSENNAIIKREGKVLVLGCKTTTIPDDIETIGNSAFYGAGDGGNLIIPNSVTSINDQAFYECSFSGTLSLSDSLQYIGAAAFELSQFSGSLTLPNSLFEIGGGAFARCGLSGELVLPPLITTINGRSFYYSNFTGTLVIPNSVTYIGLMAFEGTNFSELVLGNSLENIDNHAFNNRLSNTHLTGILRLPASLTEIGISTFAYTSFDEIYSPNTTPPLLNNSSFYECDPNIPIHIPIGCTEVYQNAEGWSYFTNFIEEVPIIYTEFEGDTCQFFQGIPEEEGFCLDMDGDSVCDFVTYGNLYNSASPIPTGFLMLGSDWEATWCFDYITIPNPSAGPGWVQWVLDYYDDVRIDTLSNWSDWVYIAPYVFNQPIVDTTFDHLVFGFRHQISGGDTEPHYCYGWVECSIRWNYFSPGNGVELSAFTHSWICVNRMVYCTIPDYPLHAGQTSMEGMELELAEWYYKLEWDDGTVTYQHLKAENDTTINNERPKVIVRSNTHYDRDTISIEVTHEYVFERNGIVYWWNNELQEFTTLYNLTADTGDEWEIKVGTESINVHVDSVGVFEYQGDTHKILHISDVGNIFNGDIVVGYGHMTSFFPEKLMNRNASYTVDGLRCYWVEDALLYHNGDEDCDAIYSEIHGVDNDGPSTGSGTLTVYPNPTNGVLFVETWRAASLQNPTYRITNLLGQTVLSGSINAETQQINIKKLPTGMYFITVDGQTVKFVVK
jgi:hypothetical protein